MRFWCAIVAIVMTSACGGRGDRHEPVGEPPHIDQPPLTTEPDKPSDNVLLPSALPNSKPVSEYIFAFPDRGDLSLIRHEDAPDGDYRLIEVSTLSRPVGTGAVVYLSHQLADPGVLSITRDDMVAKFDFAELDFVAKKYTFSVEMQLPLGIEVRGGALRFLDEYFYWQRLNNARTAGDWFKAGIALSPRMKKHITDIDFAESLLKDGVFAEGYYTNPQRLDFMAAGFFGSENSQAALQQLPGGGLAVFVRYEVDPTAAGYEKVDHIIRLTFAKQ